MIQQQLVGPKFSGMPPSAKIISLLMTEKETSGVFAPAPAAAGFSFGSVRPPIATSGLYQRPIATSEAVAPATSADRHTASDFSFGSVRPPIAASRATAPAAAPLAASSATVFRFGSAQPPIATNKSANIKANTTPPPISPDRGSGDSISLTSEITKVKESVKPKNQEMESIRQKTEHDILAKQLRANTDEHLMQASFDTRKVVPAPAVAKEEDPDKGRGITGVDRTIKLSQCKICNLEFPSRNTLFAHLRPTHPDRVKEQKPELLEEEADRNLIAKFIAAAVAA